MSRHLRKVARLILSLALILCINFTLPRLMPGSPVFTLLGPEAVGLSQKDYAELEMELGLNKPISVQFLAYASEIARGDLGYSYYYHRPVADLIAESFKRSLVLLIPSILISSVLAAVLGMLAGGRYGSLLDLSLTSAFLLVYALPSFLLAMVSLDVLGFRLGWFPLSGMSSCNVEGSFFSIIMDIAHHMVLPIAILSLSSAAAKYMVMRNSTAEVMNQDYILYARAKGVSSSRILFAHVFRNACLPLLTLIALHLGFIVSGSLLIEIVFSINGMGSLIHEAALNRDYPVLQGCFLILTGVVLGLNVLVDILYSIIDPRIKT